jgi:ATP-binding cassette subfamily B protein RaxB
MSVLAELNLSRHKRLPAVIAAEAAECGLACLAMIGAYHGHDIDLNGLRQRFALSMSGASLRSLMTIGDQLGFGARACAWSWRPWARCRPPLFYTGISTTSWS